MKLTEQELGRRLRIARQDARVKQQDAAKVLGLEATVMTRIEQGTRTIGALELVKLAELYCVPLSELLGEEGVPHV